MRALEDSSSSSEEEDDEEDSKETRQTVPRTGRPTFDDSDGEIEYG